MDEWGWACLPRAADRSTQLSLDLATRKTRPLRPACSQKLYATNTAAICYKTWIVFRTESVELRDSVRFSDDY